MPAPWLVDSARGCAAALEALLAGLPAGGGALGLDTEWAAGGSVATLQLAGPTAVLVIRMDRLAADELPPALGALLLDPMYIKTGCGVADDLALLEQQFGLPADGFVELPTLARSAPCSPPPFGRDPANRHLFVFSNTDRRLAAGPGGSGWMRPGWGWRR